MPSLLQRLTGKKAAPRLQKSDPRIEMPQPAHPPFNDRDKLIAEARAWGYFSGAIRTRRDLWAGRHMLDIGMGGGPHAVSFIEGGAASYVGVDPHVGTERVRDFRNIKDPSIPPYHAFPYTAADIMRLMPNVHLYPGRLEDVAEQVKSHSVDMAVMAAVTEHLHRPHDVLRAIWEILQPGGHLWICHCNYYSWTGHHRLPRSVTQWNRADKEQGKHIDWQHLEPTHPDYKNDNFNRIRLQDLRTVIETYFEIIEWKVSVEALERLTPQLRRKWRKYSLAELLGQNIYITGRRRDIPLGHDLTALQLHHPDEGYLADIDHSKEDIAPYTLANSVYFTPAGDLCSHSDNDHAGRRVFRRLKAGDIVTVQKFTAAMRLTASGLIANDDAELRLKVEEAIPDSVVNGNHDQWTIVDYGPKLAGTPLQVADQLPAPLASEAIMSVPPVAEVVAPAVRPLPGLDLMTATLNAIDGFARDMADVRYLIQLAKAIGAEPYEALQKRQLEVLLNVDDPAGRQQYLDVPYWVAHKLSVAQTLGLRDGPKRSLLDLWAGAGHMLRIANDHGHDAVGLDIVDPICADIAVLLGVDRRETPVKLRQPLPKLGKKFNVVTAIWTKNDHIDAVREPACWTVADWAFRIDDIVQNHMMFPAQLFLVLNQQRLVDGSFNMDDGVLTWFASQGATVDRESGTVELKLAGPRRFSAG